jgi:hypothetical protein
MNRKQVLVFFLLVSFESQSDAQFRMQVLPDYTDMAHPRQSASGDVLMQRAFPERLMSCIHAGFLPGDVQFRLKKPAQMARQQYVKIGDGYFPVNQKISKSYDTIREKTLLYAVFKPEFHINLVNKLFVYATPAAGVYFNVRNYETLDLTLDEMEVSVDKYDPESGMDIKTFLGGEAGFGYRLAPGSFVTIGAEATRIMNAAKNESIHKLIRITVLVRLFN